MLPSEVLSLVGDPRSSLHVALKAADAAEGELASADMLHAVRNRWFQMIFRPGSEHVYLARFWAQQPRMLGSEGEKFDSANETIYHLILEKDPGEARHDHPWDFSTEVVCGGYLESTPDGLHAVIAPSIHERRADFLHRIVAVRPLTVTRVRTSSRIRTWGFQYAPEWRESPAFLQSWINLEDACQRFLAESPKSCGTREALIRRLCRVPTKALRSSRRKSTNSGRSSKKSRSSTATKR